MGTPVELTLNGSWRFKGFAKLNGEESGAYIPECNSDDWLSAKVPGAIHTDLIPNNIIPDPFKNQNENAVQWVTDVEWW